MQSPDLLFAPFVSGHCIGDERSFSLVSLNLGHGHFWYNGVWVVWASGPGGGPLSLHDDIAVISTKHAERDEKRGKRDVTSTFAATTLALARTRIIPAKPVLGDGRGENHVGS